MAIYISPHGIEGRDRFELVQKFQPFDVTCEQDPIHAPKQLEHRGTQLSVDVADQPDPYHVRLRLSEDRYAF